MEQIHDRVAGLDVHRDQVTVCVRTPGPRDGVHAGKRRVSPPPPASFAALAGWLVKRAVALVAMAAELDAQIATGVAASYRSAARLLRDIPGIDHRNVEVIIAETGADMSRLPSPAHLASWAVAVAHSLLDTIWHMLTTGEIFTDLGEDYYASRHDKEQQARRLVARLQKLG
jgi:hypothetical protein